MIQAKCTEKIRDKNNYIIGYKLIDKNKNEVLVKAEKLKEVIRSGQLDIINLTLTSDNRLIDKKPDTVPKPTTASSSKQNINVEAILAKAKATGCNIVTLDTACNHKCYLACSQNNLDHILIIPDDVEDIYETNRDLDEDDIPISRIEGSLKVIGGKGLTSAHHMFALCKARSIDLSSFNTSKVTSMSSMFAQCKTNSLDLSSFNTSNVTDMSGMFSSCKVQSLDLSSFDTSKVTDMGSMFAGCKAQSLDLRCFNTSKVTNMSFMFMNCEAQSIGLSSFDTRKVTGMRWMFMYCKAHSIDLSSFNTSKVEDMEKMFCRCEAQSIDLSSFDTSEVTDMEQMFKGCKARVKVNDAKLKEQLKSRR